MDRETGELRAALRRLPVPQAHEGFVDRALALATAESIPLQNHPDRGAGWRGLLKRREAWWGAGLGAVAATLAVIAVIAGMSVNPGRPGQSPAQEIWLALNEAREVSVVIDSARELPDATIRVFVSGGIELAGFGPQEKIAWVATLAHGSNLLSLPVVARAPGYGRLVAEIEHEGRTRRAIVELRVSNTVEHGRSEMLPALQDGTV